MKPFSYAYLVYAVPLSLLAPVVAALLRRSYFRRPYLILSLYLLVSGGINLIAILHSHSNNLPYLHIYTLVEGTFLLCFYRWVQADAGARLVNGVLAVLFPAACLVNLLFLQSVYRFNSYVRPVEALLLIGNSLYYFWQEVRSEEVGRWTANPLNWINTGILLYFSGAFFQFVFSNLVSATASYNIKLLILDIHGTLVLAMYCLFTVGFVKCKR